MFFLLCCVYEHLGDYFNCLVFQFHVQDMAFRKMFVGINKHMGLVGLSVICSLRSIGPFNVLDFWNMIHLQWIEVCVNVANYTHRK